MKIPIFEITVFAFCSLESFGFRTVCVPNISLRSRGRTTNIFPVSNTRMASLEKREISMNMKEKINNVVGNYKPFFDQYLKFLPQGLNVIGTMKKDLNALSATFLVRAMASSKDVLKVMSKSKEFGKVVQVAVLQALSASKQIEKRIIIFAINFLSICKSIEKAVVTSTMNGIGLYRPLIEQKITELLLKLQDQIKITNSNIERILIDISNKKPHIDKFIADSIISLNALLLQISNSFEQLFPWMKPNIIRIFTIIQLFFTTILNNYFAGISRFHSNPWSHISIPIAAAFVGYITNYVGVKMLFYPIQWTGYPLKRWPNQPLGLFGWQGVVPTKRLIMATRLVDITISKLLNINEVFNRLDPNKLTQLLIPTVTPVVYGGAVPSPVLKYFLLKSSEDILDNIDQIVDVKDIVVTSLTKDPHTLGDFFQRVARKELSFLIDSGLGFGFILGVLQMIQWLFYPASWTLPFCGALVGYITNWIALKWIFEPLNPTKFGPFMIQGMFLKRQKEVSKDFCEYLAKNSLTSLKIWNSMLTNDQSKKKIQQILQRNIPIAPSRIQDIITALQSTVGSDPTHPIHKYTTLKLNLKNTLVQAMNKLTTSQYERVLHPIFEEDELTLILAGAVLGAVSGFLQIGMNIIVEKLVLKKKLAF